MPAWNHQVQGFGQEVLTSYTESGSGGHSFDSKIRSLSIFQLKTRSRFFEPQVVVFLGGGSKKCKRKNCKKAKYFYNPPKLEFNIIKWTTLDK